MDEETEQFVEVLVGGFGPDFSGFSGDLPVGRLFGNEEDISSA